MAIKEWAEKVRYVPEVRLFGSRAKGGTPADSDVDLGTWLVVKDVHKAT